MSEQDRIEALEAENTLLSACLVKAENARDHWLKQWELKRDEAFELRKQRDALLSVARLARQRLLELEGHFGKQGHSSGDTLNQLNRVIDTVESGKVPT